MRRYSAYQMPTKSTLEDEGTSSSKEEGSSSDTAQPSDQFLKPDIFQSEHISRPRTKRKVRSKSLQHQPNIVSWRKSSRPRRGRSLGKQPFYPGFKPEPVPVWTSEDIKLKPTPIEKKEIPKLEIQKVFLKSVTQQRNQAMLYISEQIEKIIMQKSEKEVIPWKEMREKLRAVQKVQKQLEKFELEEIHLKSTKEMKPEQHEFTNLQPSQAQQITAMEIERLQHEEDTSIMQITQEIDQLIARQAKEDKIPWKEMKEHLKAVEKTQKTIEKFKLEQVDLKSISHTQNEIVLKETITDVEDTIILKLEDSVQQKGILYKKDDIEQTQTQIPSLHKQRFTNTEDINLIKIDRQEEREIQKISKQEQPKQWRRERKIGQNYGTQKLYQTEESEYISATEKQQIVEEKLTLSEESNITKFTDQKTMEMKIEQPVFWRRSLKDTRQTEQEIKEQAFRTKEEQVIVDQQKHTEESSFLKVVDYEKIEESKKEQPVLWRRGHKETKEQLTHLIDHEIKEEIFKTKHDQITAEPLKHTEESSFLKLVDRHKISETQKEQPVFWRKGPKEIREQPAQLTEEQKQLPLEPVQWRTPKKDTIIAEITDSLPASKEKIIEQLSTPKLPEKKPFILKAKEESPKPEFLDYKLKPRPRQTVDTTQEKSEEQIVLQPVKRKEIQKDLPSKEVILMPWQRPKEEIPKEENLQIGEDKPELKVLQQIEEVVTSHMPEHEERITIEKPREKTQVQKSRRFPEQNVEEVEKVTLKPTPRYKSKEISKEALEEVTLSPVKKPTKPETADIEKQHVREEIIEQKEKTATISKPIGVEEIPKRIKKPVVKTRTLSEEEVTPAITKPKQDDTQKPYYPQKEDVVEDIKLDDQEIIQTKEAKAPWRRQKPKTTEEKKPEEIQWPKGKRRTLENEDKEQVQLKPIPRKVQKEEKSEKPEKTEQIPKVDIPKLPESESSLLEKYEPKIQDKQVEEKVEETKVPSREQQKEKSEEKPLDKKRWPKGKQRPQEPEEMEKVTLKPISRKVAEEEKPVEEHYLKTVPKQKLEKPKEETEVEIIKEQTEEKETIVQRHKIKTKKPKLLKETPSIEDVKEESVEELPEDKPDKNELEAVPVDGVKDIALVEEVIEHIAEDELLEDDIKKIKAHKKRTKQLKQITKEEHPQTQIAENVENIIIEEQKEISQKTIKLKKTEEPKYITQREEKQEQIKEVEATEFKKDIELKIQSNIVKKEKKRIIIDDSQPLPELELITQKRIQEGVDKVPDEHITEDSVVQESTEQIVSDIITQENKVIKKSKKQFKAPKFIKKLQPQKCEPEKPTILECKIEGIPFPEIKWYFNDAELFASEKYEVTTIENVTKLKIAKVTSKDIGIYTCHARNEAGVATSKANVTLAFEYVPDSEITGQTISEEDLLEKTLSNDEITINEFAPKIIKKLPNKITPKEGELTKLEVKVIGKPKPKIKWTRDGEEIIASEEYQIDTFKDGTSILVINNMYPDDIATISFEAYNPLGVAVTTTELSVEEIVGTKDYRKPEWVTHMEEMQEALKAVKCSPSIILEIKDYRAAEGENIKFECQFSGNPNPEILWYHGNILLKNSERIKITTTDNTSICEIESATKEDIGYYTCKLINEIGMNVSRAKFDLFSSTSKIEKKIEKILEGKPKAKKRVLKKSTKKVDKGLHKTIVGIIPIQSEITVEIDSNAKEVGSELKDVTTTRIIPFKKKDQKLKDFSTETTVQVQIVTEEDQIEKIIEITEISETVIEIKQKIINNTISETDIIKIKQHKEVNKILQSIEADAFGAGEAPLRDLATIGLLIRCGITITEIIFMYDRNVFVALKSPESQSALVQLVEREGHEELITQILTEESTQDEQILAATVGFRAFIRMIKVCQITIEEIIKKFVREDFIVQEWKFAAKERTIETSQVIENDQAITHIRIEQTFVEECTVIAEGSQPHL